MICQRCNQNPATLHFTKIINGEKTEIHLCDHCAQEKGEMFMFNGDSAFSINNLLASFLNMNPTFQTKETFQPEELVQCDKCSMTLQQFVKVGRFGCSHCYEAFKHHLVPIFKKLHSGNSEHNGKVPLRTGGFIHYKKQIQELKIVLQKLIAEEEFEKAAEVRDQIRTLEQKLNEQGGD